MNQLEALWNAETEWWNKFYYSQDDFEDEREVPDWLEEDDYEDSF